MNLLVDMGNSRLKWGISNGLDIVQGIPIANTQINLNTLAQLWREIPSPEKIAVSCVSTGTLFDQVLLAANTLWPQISVFRAKSVASALGVTNAYQEPGKLGVDRWLCMVSAYQNFQKALCIVDCGTAITVDLVDVSGKHLGGLISPGLNLMKESLAKRTAYLKLPDATYPFGLAVKTDAAIHNGTLSAACGMIEYILKNQPDTLQLIVTGGDAQVVASHLYREAFIDPDLVLRGLALTVHQPE
ncbi:MAG: type III pantothenate kinase [Methyloglobulus sp.]|nr:type III pantothenate kinase [Methyloglobulus sp.]